jgi:HNH endonuclease
MSASAIERFLRKVVVDEDPDACWGWTACTTHGYGMFRFDDSRSGQAHRFSYELFVGPIPDGIQVGHRCHDKSDCILGNDCPHRSCTNPKHLILQTPRENTLSGRTITALNVVKTHCVKGHEYTDDNTYWFGPGKKHRSCRQCRRDVVYAKQERDNPNRQRRVRR